MQVEQLITYWSKQGISITAASEYEIRKAEQHGRFFLPDDFKSLYSKVNGMESYYPNEIDEEGFLFYPVEAIISAAKESADCLIKNKDNIFIFAEYMHKSWLYGFEILDCNNYIIGIIPDENTFIPIAESIWDFVELYLEDSSRIYNQ